MKCVATPSFRLIWQYTLTGALISLLAIIYLFHSPFVSKYPDATHREKMASPSYHQVSIPNLAHFVYILNEPENEIIFGFADLLSVYSVLYYWNPDAIYLHTNAAEEMINRARGGGSGKWSRMIFGLPEIRIVPAIVPTHAGNGKPITIMEHKSDFVRVEAIRNYGGVYIDFDVYTLRDVKVLRESGFHAIIGRELGGQLNSGTFLSRNGSKMINAWSKEMNNVYDGGWTTHSNGALTRVSERLVAEPGQVLIMEKEAFAPGSWSGEDSIHLFQVHNEATLVPTEIFGESSSPFAQNPVPGLHDSPSHFPWATDWSKTYLLHAFKPSRSGARPDGFEGITPRYVLQKGSNFARAVYPVVRALYQRGLLGLEDVL